jgi:thymidylate synthase ThyX
MKTKQEILGSGIKTETGAAIYSVTDLPAETRATLHALNSREPGGFKSNLPKMFDDEKGTKIIARVMDTFYVNYGHKSIGDCGEADIFIDGVSMLVANAFEHWPLFNGQETSSRYVDVTVNGYHVPSDIPNDLFFDNWCARWLEFYSRLQPAVWEKIKSENPLMLRHVDCPVEDDLHKARLKAITEWENATKARSFDIAGAFLPCGAKTNFSEVINLRQWSDELQILVHHPLSEVRVTAKNVLQILHAYHPNSFKVSKRPEKEEYMKEVAKHLFGGGSTSDICSDFTCTWKGTGIINGNPFWGIERPPGCDLPFDTASIGSFKVIGKIDYRSFRDLHRHRNVIWKMPIVGVNFGFEKWYLDQLPEDFQMEAAMLLLEYEKWYLTNDINVYSKQYTTPMGYKVGVNVTMPFNAAVYIAELRSGPKVHPTARRFAIKLGQEILKVAPSEFTLHLCEDEDSFVLARGKDDIVKK